MSSDTSDIKSSLPVCRNCSNYFVTHDPSNPYGCRAMGFKSKKSPARVVFESSGIHCQLFSARKQTKPGGGGRGTRA